MFEIDWPIGEWNCRECNEFVDLPTPPDMAEGDMADITCPACGEEADGMFLQFVDGVDGDE